MSTSNLCCPAPLLALVLFSSSLHGQVAEEEKKIREVRSASNQAILSRDVESLKRTWMSGLFVNGSNGQTVRSADEMAAIFEKVFRNPEFIKYVRKPEKVNLSPGSSIAAESGSWAGHWNKPDGKMTVKGSYMAQWQKKNERWLISSEVFVTRSCEGSSACKDLP